MMILNEFPYDKGRETDYHRPSPGLDSVREDDERNGLMKQGQWLNS